MLRLAAQILSREPEPVENYSVRFFVVLDDNRNISDIGAIFPKGTLFLLPTSA